MAYVMKWSSPRRPPWVDALEPLNQLFKENMSRQRYLRNLINTVPPVAIPEEIIENQWYALLDHNYLAAGDGDYDAIGDALWSFVQAEIQADGTLKLKGVVGDRRNPHAGFEWLVYRDIRPTDKLWMIPNPATPEERASIVAEGKQRLRESFEKKAADAAWARRSHVVTARHALQEERRRRREEWEAAAAAAAAAAPASANAGAGKSRRRKNRKARRTIRRRRL